MLGHMVKQVLSKSTKFNLKSTSSNIIPNHILFNIDEGIESIRDIIDKNGPFDYIINCTYYQSFIK